MTSFCNLSDKEEMRMGGEGEREDGDGEEEGRDTGGERKERDSQTGSLGCRMRFVEDCLKRLNAFPYKDGQALI